MLGASLGRSVHSCIAKLHSRVHYPSFNGFKVLSPNLFILVVRERTCRDPEVKDPSKGEVSRIVGSVTT